MKRSICGGVLVAIGLLGPVTAVRGQLSEDEHVCVNAMNHRARKVLFAEQRGNWKTCIKGQTGDMSVCVATEHPKTMDERAKLAVAFANKCSPLPAFGVIGDPDDIADASTEAADEIIRGIFGNPVNGLDASKCQAELAQRAGRLAVRIRDEFRICVQDIEVVNSIADIEACVATAITRGEGCTGIQVDDRVAAKCSVIPPPGTEDGACGTETTAADFSACVRDLTDCEVCLSINIATGGSADCDALDDGLSNLSCP